MTKRFLSAQALALIAGLALASVGPATGAPKGVVDPKISSIVPDDAAALGFDAAKFEAARSAALKADVAEVKIVGAYLLIGRHGKVAFQEGFGTQGPGQTAPMTDKTIFRVFSMSKPIVSVTAMTLVEEAASWTWTRRSRKIPVPEYANLRGLEGGRDDRSGHPADAGAQPDEPYIGTDLRLHPAHDAALQGLGRRR